MRLVGGTAFVARTVDALAGGSSLAVAAAAIAVVAGACLIAGFWTPIAGSVVTVSALWLALSGADDPLANVLIATIGGTLALLGPGAWSIDARLFGWKRIDVRERRK
jgi:uncharacterized membrane protein YphA (DoxX/SURF4 family)